MITERELMDAIAECHSERKPNANTCIKLASYYSILDHIAPSTQAAQQAQEVASGYSTAAGYSKTEYSSGTEFSDAIRGKDIESVLAVIDELMTALQAIYPRLYNGAMKKLLDL